MFLLNKPSDSFIEKFLQDQKDEGFSYLDVGASANKSPTGYNVDHNRILLGNGRTTYSKAIDAINQWKMFDFSWLRLCWNDAPIEAGTTVGILVSHLGFWSLNACRIVYTVNETGDIDTHGFAYGTLWEHAERGEERFRVEYHHLDDSVWYDIYAFSKPNQLLARLGSPLSRMLQRRFAEASMNAMRNAVVPCLKES